MRFTPSLFTISLCSLFSSSLFAQSGERTTDKNNVESITVTASGFEQLLSQAPASVSVIDRKQLAQRAYKDITDALRDVPGVTVTGGDTAKISAFEACLHNTHLYLLMVKNKQVESPSQMAAAGMNKIGYHHWTA